MGVLGTKGANGRSREEIEKTTAIPSNSIFVQAHQLYLAPVIVGVIVAAVVAIIGIVNKTRHTDILFSASLHKGHRCALH